MPDEPNNRMDEKLRAYARQRRDAPDLQVHPVTRKMLQAEVRRVYGAADQPRSWRSRLRAFWPQIAFSGALCGIFAIAVMTLREPARETVRDSSAPDTKPQIAVASDSSAESARVPAPVAPEALALNKEKAAGSADSVRGGEIEEPYAPPQPAKVYRQQATSEAAGAGAQNPALGVGVEFSRPAAQPPTDVARRSVAGAESRAEVTSSRQLDVGAAVPGRATLLEHAPKEETYSYRRENLPLYQAQVPVPDESGDLTAGRRIAFVQLASGVGDASEQIASAAARVPVLTSFAAFQTGTNLQLVDRDGSVYFGTLQEQVEPSAELQAGALGGLVQNSSIFNFRVQGTNRTLNQQLTLTGQYLKATSDIPVTVTTERERLQFGAAKAIAPVQSQARHAIIGNALVGTTNEVPITAISREP